jgi:phosphoribosylaminoimidazolecarboxamide formyltransferase/IMP cyclohydrolase
LLKPRGSRSVALDDLIEQIDIGGPSLLRAAAKNFGDVLVVVNPYYYQEVLKSIDEGPTLAFRYELMVKAFAHTAEYDSTIAATLLQSAVEGDRVARARSVENAYFRPTIELGDTIDLSLRKLRDLRYGENPHQKAAWYVERSDGAPYTILQGKELSFTNLLDIDAASRIVLEFSEPAAVVIKHTNPCGAATGESAADAYTRARDADSLAAFGGIVGLNRPIDVAAAEAIVSTFIEAVIAPSVEPAARDVLAKKTNMRVVTADVDATRPGVDLRSLMGSILVQQRDVVAEAERHGARTRCPRA